MVALAACYRARLYQNRPGWDRDRETAESACRQRRRRKSAPRLCKGPRLSWRIASLDYLAETQALRETQAFLAGVLHVVIAGAVTVHALLTKREAPAAIGWIGLAWLAPVLGALLYVGFGINRVKRRARRLKRPIRSADPIVTGDTSSEDPLERLKAAIGKITGQDMAAGEVVAILDGGDQAYPQMLAAIESAKSHIRLCTYIFRTDEIGLKFIDALARAHGRGVRIRVLIDGFGGGFLRSLAYHGLRRQGVAVARFLHSTLPWKMPFLDLRLHKKSLVVDGRSAFVGGLNIGAENLMAKRPKTPVRDTHFRLEGTIVRQIEQAFDDDWSFATGEEPIRTGPASEGPACGGSAARVIASGPDQEVDQLVLVLLSATNLARRTIRIATPYFLPDEQLITALQLAALRGVDVHLVLPAQNNHRLVAWAAQTHVRPLLEAGCRLWRSPPPFDHSKLMTIDGEWSLIGSANWDMRSLRLNFELTVEIYDKDLAARLGAIIDSRCVQPITLEEVDNRPFPVKLRDAAARLSMPYI
ncbi:MAG: cardiolipin synthase [Hyphomicrobiales bacterium]|nr:cardiolipin synthase [Hyphomicrobiales bacterium]